MNEINKKLKCTKKDLNTFSCDFAKVKGTDLTPPKTISYISVTSPKGIREQKSFKKCDISFTESFGKLKYKYLKG